METRDIIIHFLILVFKVPIKPTMIMGWSF
jgi:hypothetical protein